MVDFSYSKRPNWTFRKHNPYCVPISPKGPRNCHAPFTFICVRKSGVWTKTLTKKSFFRMTATHNVTALLKQGDLNREALIVTLCYSHTLKLFPQSSIAHKITLPGTYCLQLLLFCYCKFCWQDYKRSS